MNAVKSYFFMTLLFSSIVLGGFTGYLFPGSIHYLKPLGELFINLILTIIVPLVFFSISAATARSYLKGQFFKILFYTLLIFMMTSVVASVYMIGAVKLFLPVSDLYFQSNSMVLAPMKQLTFHWRSLFQFTDVKAFFSTNNMLPMMVFAMFIGIAINLVGRKAIKIVYFLQKGESFFMRVFSIIMYYAPIGFFSYFAVLVSEFGPKLFQHYVQVTVLYYVAAIIYFLIAFSIYAYFAGSRNGISLFWKIIPLPLMTSIATCSSVASIPANLTAAKQMRIPEQIYETVIPLGAMIHKDGSVMGGVIKIAFLFGLFHFDFSGSSVLLMAVGVSLLVGMVMGGIPSGGMLGELLILNVYGFPLSCLIAIAAISIIIDPIATMINVTGDTVSAMLVGRFIKN
jgi:Na+/H+-dicarboxylate symporter